MNVSVVIPAYNEEKTIGAVISAVVGNKKVKEIIVVSDGSTDRTVEEVRRFGKDVVLLDYKVNRGKGCALYRGIRKAKYPLIVLLDADLTGLRSDHIDRLIAPLEKGTADHVLAAIDLLREGDKRYLEYFKGPYEWWHVNYSTLFSGQRAAYKEDLVKVKDIKDSKYGVELLITDYYLANNKKIKKLIFDDVTHYWKPEKWGKEGRKLRVLMYRDILKTFDKLEAKGSLLSQGFPPRAEKSKNLSPSAREPVSSQARNRSRGRGKKLLNLDSLFSKRGKKGSK